MTNYIYHYVYRITNKILSKHYYGSRSCNILPKEDLGVKYFSSSYDKEFRQDQLDNPQNYRYKIICVTKTRDVAILKEIKLHTKFNVKVNPSFYNKSNQTSTGFDITGTKGRIMSEKQKEHLRKPKTEAHKQKTREARKKQVLINVSRLTDRKVMDLGNFIKWCNGVMVYLRKQERNMAMHQEILKFTTGYTQFMGL